MLTLLQPFNLDTTKEYTFANATLGNLATANYYTGNGSLLSGVVASTANTVITAAQPNITSTGTLSSLTVSGLIVATGTGIKTANIQDSTGTITITTRNGNIAGDVGVYGNLTAGTSGTGNVIASYFIGDGSLLTGLPASYSNTNVAAYLPTYTGNVAGNYFIGDGSLLTGVTTSTAATVTNNAQPNITSIGNLTGLVVSNSTGVVDFTTSANVTLGNISNLHITGGSANYVIITDGAGNLSWGEAAGGGGVTLVNNTTENSNTFYPLMSNTTVSGTLSTVNLANSKLFFNPSTGTLNSTIFNSLSDETVKTNRQRITNALSKLSTLGGYTYLMIDSNEPSAGLLAQEVQKVLPEAVKFNPDTGLLSLNYNAVLGLVVESINELEQRITGLENAR